MSEQKQIVRREEDRGSSLSFSLRRHRPIVIVGATCVVWIALIVALVRGTNAVEVALLAVFLPSFLLLLPRWDP
jgi:hypothetical protein